jgi:hypothetical protein
MIDQEIANTMFELSQSIDESMKKKCMDELLDVEQMKDIIMTKGNLSAPRIEKLTNTIVKIERGSAVRMIAAIKEAVF